MSKVLFILSNADTLLNGKPTGYCKSFVSLNFVDARSNLGLCSGAARARQIDYVVPRVTSGGAALSFEWTLMKSALLRLA